jgi:hypothetical protein
MEKEGRPLCLRASVVNSRRDAIMSAGAVLELRYL